MWNESTWENSLAVQLLGFSALYTAHCTIQTLRSPFSPKKKKKSGVENKKRKTKLWVWGYLCFREEWWQGKWKVGSNAYWQGDSVLNSKLQIKVSSDEVLGRTTLETGGTHSPSPSYCPERQFSSSFLVCLYRSYNPSFRVKMPFFFFFFLWRMQWFVLPQFTKAWRVIEKGTNTKWSSSGLGAPLWVVFHLCYFTQPSLQNCNFEQPRQEAKDWASKDRQASDSTAG